MNLLDHPATRTFSEDTYRVLTAVDSALMVVDGAKGVEETNHQADGGLPTARHPDLHLCEQARSAIFATLLMMLDEIETVLKIKVRADQLAARHGQRIQGCL